MELIGEIDEAVEGREAYANESDQGSRLRQGVESGYREGSGQYRELRGEIAKRLAEEVGGMSLDNFLVRAKRRYVEKFSDLNAWQKLGLNERSELIEHVAGLPSALVDDDLAAKQFDLLILRAQLCILRHDPALDACRRRIIEIAGLLEELANVPLVAKEMQLILEVQTDEYWQDVTAPMLETVRRRLRSLISLIEIKNDRSYTRISRMRLAPRRTSPSKELALAPTWIGFASRRGNSSRRMRTTLRY